MREHKCIWVEHTGTLRCCVYEGCNKLEILELSINMLKNGTMEDRLVYRLLTRRDGKGNS